jgi:hypothetical protein
MAQPDCTFEPRYGWIAVLEKMPDWAGKLNEADWSSEMCNKTLAGVL